MKSCTIIINEQHTMLPDQIAVLTAAGYPPESCNMLLVPASGWDREKMGKIMNSLFGDIVFVSPIPLMIKELSASAALNWSSKVCSCDYPYAPAGEYPLIDRVFVLCNDTRVKKELPNGKIISVTSQTGWYLA